MCTFPCLCVHSSILGLLSFGVDECYNVYLSCNFTICRGYKDSPAIYKGVDGETTVVDRVMLCSDINDKLSIKCIIRHTRRPEVWFVCSMHLFSFFGYGWI